MKSVGMSILEPYVFKTFKLVEVTDEPQPKTTTNETETPQVDMNSYMTKEDFEPYKEIINDMKSVVEELKG